MKNLNETPSNLMEKHRKLAGQLLSLHVSESPYNQLPSYEYDQLRKGVICFKCYSFSLTFGRKKYICKKCLHEELIEDAVLRSIDEFRLLFPNRKITTKIIYNWCQIVPERRIRNILLKNFSKMGEHRWSYFN